MDTARLKPAHARPHTLPETGPESHDFAAHIVDALDRVCADCRGHEWNAFLLDIRPGDTGEYLVRVGVFGPIQSELTIRVRTIEDPCGMASIVPQAVAEWIAKYDPPSGAARRAPRLRQRVSVVTCAASL